MIKTTQQALGLYRTPNQLGVAQDGAYMRLDECVIRSKDVVEPRLGHSLVSTYIGGNAGDTRRFNALFQSTVGMLGQYGSGAASGIKVVDGASTEILTNVPPPSPWVRNRFADCQKRCYVTTDSGLKRIYSSLVGAAAGGLAARISTKDSFPVKDASGFAAAGSACLYRAVLVSFAPDGSEIVGPPSNRYYLRVPPDRTIAIGGAVRSANVTTITTNAAHGLRSGDSVTLTFDAADTGAGKFTTGIKQVVAVTSTTVFTFTDNAANYNNTVAATCVFGPVRGAVLVKLPAAATTADVVRVYRSELATTAFTATPSDDVYLVFEAYLTAANVSTGGVTVVDNTPEVLLGDPSYFSPSVEGEGGSNDAPPLAWDVATIGDALVLANLTYHHQLELRLLATGGTLGVQVGTTLTITRTGYNTLTTDAANSNADSAFFVVYSGSTGASVARDNEMTALDLCDTINSLVDNNWLDATYVSSGADAPGRIRFKCRDFAATAFTVIADERGTAWGPNLPTSGTTVTSHQETDSSGIAFSKPGQPDAFPPTLRQRAGATSEKSLRVLPVREKLIVLKEESAWLVSGAWPAYRVDLLDDTCGFHLPDTAAALDNQVYTLSSIGVVAVSEAGVALVGGPLEGDTRNISEQAARLSALIAAGYTPQCLASWGAADELEHRYLLAIPSQVAAPATPSTVALLTDVVWCFNAGARAWSGPWSGNWRHAHRYNSANSSSRLAFALNSLPAVSKELGIDSPIQIRHADYYGQTLYVSAKAGSTLTLLAIAGGDPTSGALEVGDGLYNSTTGHVALIGSVTSAAAGTVVVDDPNGVTTTTTLRVIKGYEAWAEWVPMHGGVLPADSQMHTAVLALSDERFRSASVRVSSELSGAETEARELAWRGFGYDGARDSAGADVDVGFGGEPFGHLAPLRRERCQVPADAQRAGFHSVIFRTREAGAFWRLHGLSLDFEAQGIKGVR